MRVDAQRQTEQLLVVSQRPIWVTLTRHQIGERLSDFGALFERRNLVLPLLHDAPGVLEITLGSLRVGTVGSISGHTVVAQSPLRQALVVRATFGHGRIE